MKIGLFLFGWLVCAGSVWAGPPLIEENGCGRCHRFASGEQPAAPGPDLSYAGDKFRETWLREFLRKPTIVRKAEHITGPGFVDGKPETAPPHPALTAEESDRTAAYLMTLHLPAGAAGKVDAEPLSKADRVRMKVLFERQYGCIGCHKTLNLAGQVRGGVSGPPLVDAGKRLQPGWIFQWLKTPKKFLSRGRMPVYDLDDTTAAGLTKYILSIRSR